MMLCSVFDFHHQVLHAWADYRRHQKYPTAALTLDYHTDTLPAFGRHFPDGDEERLKFIRSVDFHDPWSIQQAVSLLRHDEHLDLAVQSGIISESTVISHFPPSLPPENGIRTVSPDWPDQNILLNHAEMARPLADSVLEDPFLSAMLEKAPFIPEEHRGFVLDIDLDYFLTLKSIHPVQNSIWQRLKDCAGLITISREDDWIRILRLDPGLNSETLLNGLAVEKIQNTSRLRNSQSASFQSGMGENPNS